MSCGWTVGKWKVNFFSFSIAVTSASHSTLWDTDYSNVFISPLWGSLLAVVLVAFLFFSWFYFIVLLFFFFSLMFFFKILVFFFFFCFLILLEQYIEAHVKFCYFPLVTGEISENKHSSSEVRIWVLLVLLMNSDKSSQWSCFDLTDLAVLTFFSASAAQVPSFL